MSLAIIYSRASSGIQAPLVTVEAHISKGLPRLNIVGLPEAAVKESKDRVRSALINSGFQFPARRITINLAPADLPKEGGRFDLPIAIGILAASKQIPQQLLKQYEFTGELALSGELRAVHGILPIVLGTNEAKRFLILPTANATEAALVQNGQAYAASHILNVCEHLKKTITLPLCVKNNDLICTQFPDLSDVQGQFHAKRALEIAAAGKHNLLLMGPPGTGKTMLASRLPGILPEMTDLQALETAAVASVSSGGFDASLWKCIPFRSPHHSSSAAALVGGGRPPRPGEISLAHHGILFLDELTEFDRRVLESLREPLESGSITISRAAYQAVFPAKFQLVAAMNPCPCGFVGSLKNNCRCTQEQIQRYLAKLSGPLLDRIDMQIEVPTQPLELFMQKDQKTLKSAITKAKVISARQQQFDRQGKCNQDLNVTELGDYCNLTETSQKILHQMIHRFNLSMRVYHRIIKIARTIADLDSKSTISDEHVSEALTYRCLDRNKLNYSPV